jgi:hypothetical protein
MLLSEYHITESSFVMVFSHAEFNLYFPNSLITVLNKQMLTEFGITDSPLKFKFYKKKSPLYSNIYTVHITTGW